MFSSHDTNVNGALLFLQMTQATFDYQLHETDHEFVRTNAPLASSILFEIHSNSTVSVIFNGRVMKQPYCGNQEYCPVDTFLGFIKSNTYDKVEWNQRCS